LVLYLSQVIEIQKVHNFFIKFFIYNSIMKLSLQPSKSRTYQSYLMVTLAILFVIFPFFILKSISNAILYLFLLFISIGSSLFFWVSFVPFFPISFPGFFNTIKTLILSIFRSTNPAYHIQAGKFDRDYFVIQDKPKLDALLIDENSAVIVINNERKKRVLSSGFQFINKGEQILHTFDLGFQHFFWGPQENENPFKYHIPDLNLNQIHLRSLRFAQTKYQTTYKITVIPSFSIFYGFSSLVGKKQMEEMLLNISNYFSSKKINGKLQIEINELIGKSVMNIWKVFLENTNAKQLISPADQNLLLMDKFLTKINTIINTKTAQEILDPTMFNESNLLKSVKPLEQWKALNIRVFLNNIWIQQDVP